MTLDPTTVGLLAYCVAAEIGRELCFKSAADGAQSATHYAVGLAQRPLLWLGLALWTSEAVASVRALARGSSTPISSVTNLAHVGTATGGPLLFRERLSRSQMAGAALIAVGVVCVGASGL